MSLNKMPGLGKSGTLRMRARTEASVSTLVAGTTTRSGADWGREDTPRGVGAARAGTRLRDDLATEPFALAMDASSYLVEDTAAARRSVKPEPSRHVRSSKRGVTLACPRA